MNIKKLLLPGIAGGVVFFLLGWLIYGVVLMDFMKAHTGLVSAVDRPPNQMLFPYLFLGNLFSGFMFPYIFLRASVSKWMDGLIMGGILGFLISASYDCITYATTFLTSRSAMAADIVGYTIMSAVAGAIVAWLLGRGNKS
ncbi:MAG: hypothetical protein JST58_08555 [Bacteroidetes bacterium]|nr:hypothetical protein [Bacteroidota bacterium]